MRKSQGQLLATLVGGALISAALALVVYATAWLCWGLVVEGLWIALGLMGTWIAVAACLAVRHYLRRRTTTDGLLLASVRAEGVLLLTLTPGTFIMLALAIGPI